MGNFTGKYLKVWKVKESNGYIRLDLGDSQKNKNGEYDNWTWFDCSLFGEAAKKEVNEGDVIEVTSGLIYQEKYQDKWYTRVKIFHLHVTESAGPPQQQSAPAASKFQPGGSSGSKFKPGGSEPFEDEIPF